MTYELSRYAQNEKLQINRRLNELSHEPLHVRQANRKEYAKDLHDTRLVVQRIEWMLDGCYGQGAYLICQDIMSRPRMNRVAALSQMIGGLEWQCSALEARKAYLSLDSAAQDRINAAIQAVIDERDSQSPPDGQGVTA